MFLFSSFILVSCSFSFFLSLNRSLTHTLFLFFFIFSPPTLFLLFCTLSYSESQSHRNTASEQLDASLLAGIQVVVPNMSDKCMSYPTVCSEYFRFVSFACEGYPERMMTLGENVSNGILATIRFGIAHHDNIVVRQSLRAVQEMSEHCAKANGLVVARGARVLPPGTTPSPVGSSVLQDWLRLLVELMLKESRHVSDILSDGAGALLTLIICEHPTLLQLAQSVAETHPHESTRENVAEAFRALIGSNGVRCDKIDRMNRRLFQKNLMTFVETMRGLGVN